MKKKGYAKGGMPMTTVNGKKVPKFAADGKGANDMKKGMRKGGMAKKGYAHGGMACGASNPAERPMKKSK